MTIPKDDELDEILSPIFQSMDDDIAWANWQDETKKALKAREDRIAVEARLDELRHLTEWKIDETGNDKYDILFARHKRSYDDRVADLTTQLEELKQ